MADRVEAGRETDARVAIIFGATWDEDGYGLYLNPGEEDERLLAVRLASGTLTRISLPRYSRDIAAAWQVLAAMKAKGMIMASVNESSEAGWWCVLYPPEGPAVESDYYATAELAICAAALAAVGVLDGKVGT